MGYTTIYAGRIELDRPLTPELVATLHTLYQGETEVTPGGTVLGVPLKEIAGYKTVEDSCCMWVPTEDGTALVWSKDEKFYNEIEWIHWLKATLLRDYEMNGMLYALGEEWSDVHTLHVAKSTATRERGLFDLEHNAELLVELIRAEEEYSCSKSRAWILMTLCTTQEEIEGLIIDLGAGDISDVALSLLHQTRIEVRDAVREDAEASSVCRHACTWYASNPTLEGWGGVKAKFRTVCDTETDLSEKKGSAYTLMEALYGRSDVSATFWLEVEKFSAELKEFKRQKVWEQYKEAIEAYETLPTTRNECVETAIEESKKLQAGVGKVVGELARKMGELLADNKETLTTDPMATGQVMKDLQRFSDAIWQVRKALAWRTSR